MRSSPGSPTPVARRSTPASRLSSVPPAASATPSASALPFSSTLVALTSTRPASLDDSRFHTIGRSAYSFRGFSYCDLLLGRAEPVTGSGLDGLAGLDSRPEDVELFRQTCLEVLERARQTLEWIMPQNRLLDIALDHLSLGRAHLGLALSAPQPAAPGENRAAGLARAVEPIDRAVSGLRR